MKRNVILVEDDLELANLTSDFLAQFEFSVEIIATVEQAVPSIVQQQPDLVLLDIMLPDGDGLDVCRAIKGQYHGKLIMLTARTDTIDQVLGLELGADDYIAKPVEPRLLLAKCRAVLRREHSPQTQEDNAPQVSQESGLTINRKQRTAYFQQQELELSNPEFELLSLLVDNPGTIFSRDDISKHLRGIEYDGVSRQIDIYISSIRHQLKDDITHPKLIKTIRSKGYVFIG